MAKKVTIKIPTFPRTTAVLGATKDAVAAQVPVKVVRNQERLARKAARKQERAAQKLVQEYDKQKAKDDKNAEILKTLQDA